MSVLAYRRTAAFAAVIFVTILAGAKSSDSPYPNELKGFEFYAKYLAPLRPGISSENAARKVLGDTAAVQRNGWTINTSYAVKSGPVYYPALGPLAEIIVRPDGVVPMGAVKFPPVIRSLSGCVRAKQTPLHPQADLLALIISP